MREKLKSILASKNYWYLLLAVFALSRVATLLYPFDSDHWIFYYVGRRWAQGDILYLEVWDHKSPLIFAINSAMHAVLGGNIVLHRAFLFLIAILGLWLFYLTAKRVFEYIGRKSVEIDARIATLAFAFWGSLSQFTNSGNNTENFGILGLILSVYYYLRWRSSNKWKWLLYSGVAASCLVFLKINFSILLLPLILDLLITQRKNLKKLFFYALIWLLPIAAQVMLWLSYFIPRNLVREFFIATISFNSKYLRAGWSGNLSGQAIFLAILAVGFLFFAGSYYYLLKKSKTEKLFLNSLGASALLFSVILGTFYNHYYLVVLPFFCLVFAAYWRQVIKNKLLVSLLVVSVVLSFGVSTKQLYNRFYGSAAAEAVNMASAASYIRKNTTAEDTIIFYGYGATFYRLAGRDSGSRYISASHPLIDERENFGFNFDDKFIGDMAVSKPKYVIVDESTIDIYAENKKVIDYFQRHYQLEAVLPGFNIWKIYK